MTTFDDAIKEAYASAPEDEIILSTLELHHSSFAIPMRLVRDNGELIEIDSEDLDGMDLYGLYFTLEDDAPENGGEEVLFQSLMFKFKLPEQQESRITGLELTIENATKIISRKLDEIVTVRSPLSIIYREYLASNTAAPSYTLKNMSISSIKTNVTSVIGIAEFMDLVNRKFPNKVYRPEEFRSLLG